MKRILLFVTVALMLSSCVKQVEPTIISFSVLGDSFSSLAGTVDPETNYVWPYESINLTSAEQMWWHKVATTMEWNLDKNNSFSGSLVCNHYEFEGSAHYAPNSFIRRMDNLGNPNVILVFGATNDIYQRAALGDYVYANWSEEQLCSFRPALAYMFDYMMRKYPKAEVYFLLDMELCINDTTIDDETRQAYLESVHRITSHYNVRCIDIYGIQKSMWHPNPAGQDTIASQVLEVLLPDFNI